MIVIVDYGLGNISAIAMVYKFLNIPVRMASTPDELADAVKIILPGVGAFDYAMEKLNNSGMRETLEDLVQVKGRSILGICVGMQMLARSSEEGDLPGLGWLDAEIRKFDEQMNENPLSIPHMGWNNISPAKAGALMTGLGEGSYFYFLHSYYFETNDEKMVLARTHYGTDFVCAVNQDNIFGVQFHPEKSHEIGINLLKNFAKL